MFNILTYFWCTLGVPRVEVFNKCDSPGGLTWALPWSATLGGGNHSAAAALDRLRLVWTTGVLHCCFISIYYNIMLFIIN